MSDAVYDHEYFNAHYREDPHWKRNAAWFRQVTNISDEQMEQAYRNTARSFGKKFKGDEGFELQRAKYILNKLAFRGLRPGERCEDVSIFTQYQRKQRAAAKIARGALERTL